MARYMLIKKDIKTLEDRLIKKQDHKRIEANENESLNVWKNNIIKARSHTYGKQL